MALLTLALCFILPPLVFTQLYSDHIYYQYANGIFAIIAVGLGLNVIAARTNWALSSILLGGIVIGQLVYFNDRYASIVATDFTRDRIFVISQAVKRSVTDDEGILIIGQDWSSAIPFYSQRKALALPAWTPRDLLRRAVENPQDFLGGFKLGGIVYCTSNGYSHDAGGLIDVFVSYRAVLANAGNCQLLSPTKIQ